MNLYLLPEPQSCRLTRGTHPLRLPLYIHLSSRSSDSARDIVLNFIPRFTSLGIPSLLFPTTSRTPARGSQLLIDCRSDSEDQSYQLTITPKRISLRAAGPAGTRYGLWTLWQIQFQSARNIPCLEIRDRPALEHRGLLLDVSRGRIPDRHRLSAIAQKLAALKFNMLQLYVEHTYDFVSHPGIPDTPSRLTSSDIILLQRHCREQGLQLVPCLALLGHMGRVLSLPQYRDLAELPPPAEWEKMTWQQRLRGATLCPALPAARRLAADLLTEYASLHSAPFVNACCDEPYDLGKKQLGSRRRHPSKEFTDYIGFLNLISRRLGKRLMIWGDFPENHPEIIPHLPEDIIILDWGYEPQMDFEKCRTFASAGLTTLVCPSLRGYRRVFHDSAGALANIRGYADAAVSCGARGLLLTEWGDMGHFNMLPSGYYGLAAAAALSWNPRTSPAYLRRAFALFFAGKRDSSLPRFYQKAQSPMPSWPLTEQVLDSAFSRSASRPEPLDDQDAELLLHEVHGPLMDEQDRQELFLAFKASALARQLASFYHNSGRRKLRMAQELKQKIHEFRHAYSRVWRAGYLPHRLRDIERVFWRLEKDLG